MSHFGGYELRVAATGVQKEFEGQGGSGPFLSFDLDTDFESAATKADFRNCEDNLN